MMEINNYTSLDELRKRVMDAAAPNGEVAMLQSHTTYNDGGGGIFWWDKNSDAADNNGTIIAPEYHNGPGRWIRNREQPAVWSVRWFGAKGNGHSNDFKPLQDVVDAAWEAGGGRVYFPAGEYIITSPLVIKRSALVVTDAGDRNIRQHPIRFFGDGPGLSSIHARNIGDTEAAITFEEGVQRGAEDCAFEDMSFGRTGRGKQGSGTVFRFSSEGAGESARLRRCVMRNLHIKCNHNKNGHAALSLDHAHELVIENVRVSGGKVAAHFKNCSRVVATRLHTYQDRDSHIGFHLEGGGTFLFNDLRCEATTNTAVLLDGGVKRVQFNSLNFECKEDLKLLHIKDASHITILNGSIGAPVSTATNEHVGIEIESAAYNVWMRGLSVPSYQQAGVGSLAIWVKEGARQIQILDVEPIGNFDYEKDILVEKENTTGHDTVFIQTWKTQKGNSKNTRRQWVRGLVRPTGFVKPELDASDGEVFQLHGDELSRIVNGYHGQTITLIFDIGVQILHMHSDQGNIRLAGGIDWSKKTNGPGDTLLLICSHLSGDEEWLEVSRSRNSNDKKYKPKKKPEDRIHPYLDQPVPSVLTSAFFQTAKRFLAGRDAANDLEAKAFNNFQILSINGREAMNNALEACERLPQSTQQRLFAPQLIMDLDHAVDPVQMVELLADEFTKRTSLEVFGDPICIDDKHPGLVRQNDSLDGAPIYAPEIHQVNGLRTYYYAPSKPHEPHEPMPRLTLGEYLNEEIQQICTPEIGTDSEDARLNCRPQTDNCPGHSKEGTCLRVSEFRPGDAVVLTGVNFYDVNAKVQLKAKAPGLFERVVDAHVCGDTKTPLTELVDGVVKTIIDSRVNDMLVFRIPEDLPDAIYSIRVIVSHNNDTKEFVRSNTEFIRILPSSSTTFQIASEHLKCVEETSPGFWGSDEVGINVIAIPIDNKMKPLDSIISKFKFSDVDTGNGRTMNKILFQGKEISGVSLGIIGFEIDSEGAYEQQIAEFGEAFELYLTDSLHVFSQLLGAAVGTGTVLALGLSSAWIGAIAAGIVLAIGIFYAIWAPADLIIEDSIGLSELKLGSLTSPNFPPPPNVAYTTAGGIKVEATSQSKSFAYVEVRKYRSDDEDSRYNITLRYNRV